MPPLRRPPDKATISLPPRTAEVVGGVDVLVVGGGPAGLGAAMGAAAAGADVVLAERYGFLGGNATAALVNPLMSFHTQKLAAKESPGFSLLPSDHGPGDPIIAGVLATLLNRLVKAKAAIAPSMETGYVVPFDPEIFKGVAMDLLDESGVRYLFHALASDAVMEGDRIRGVVFETKSGPVAVLAETVVDCSGDGDVAARSGAPFEVGREDGLVQPMTLMFRMAEFSRAAFEGYVREHPDQWRGVHGLWDLVRKASSEGELKLAREDILLFATPHEGVLSVNSTRVTRVLGTDVWDLTYAEWESRRQMRQVAAFLRKYVPGFEKSYVVQSGANVGVRETRRVMGEYRLTAEDVLSARKFPDAVARSTYPMDIHNPAGEGTALTRLPLGEFYEIPLRCLLPLNVEGLLTAGRCISGSHEAHSSYRVMPVSVATGQAAGICAGLAARTGKRPRDIPAQAVQSELLRQGANLQKAA